MKNKIILALIIIFFFNDIKLRAEDEFNFDITEIEITNDGNFFKGIKRGTAVTNDNQTIITADTFEYDKITNILKAKGNVVMEDKIKDFLIKSNYITYYKNEEKVFSKGKTNANIESKYNVTSTNVTLDRKLNILESDEETLITDDKFTKYQTDILYLKINENIFKGKNVQIFTNTNKDENEIEFYNFKDGIFNLKNKEFIAINMKMTLEYLEPPPKKR